MPGKIETSEQAVAYVTARLGASETRWPISVEVLWTVASSFVVGVVFRAPDEHRVYSVGPRGRFDRWIHGDAITSSILAEFFARPIPPPTPWREP
jgi:hypothetical protein